MSVPLFQNKIRKIAISQKLYLMITVVGILLALEIFIIWFALHTLSTGRAFLSGESFWSKAQKNAVLSLFQYARSNKEADYQQYLEFLKVPLGDQRARLAVYQQIPDLDIARAGLTEGRNRPEDLDGIIELLQRYKNVSFIKNAVNVWQDADVKLQELITVSNQMHEKISGGNRSPEIINPLLDQVHELNLQLTGLADTFSATISDGARWLRRTVLIVLLILSLIIAGIILLIASSVSRGVVKGVKEIIKGTDLVAQGHLDTRVQVYSNDEIGKLAASFNHMIETLELNMNRIQELQDAKISLSIEKERAEASEKMKQLLVAKMSHEIRTPLNAILGFAKLLEESLTIKEQQEYMRIILKSGDSLMGLLNDILDFSKIESGQIVFENGVFSPGDTVATIKKMMEPKAVQKGLRISCDLDERLPRKVLGDVVRLKQVLLNLASNAVNFTTEGTVNLYAVCQEETADQFKIRFGVKDTGMGIPEAQQKRIFEGFEQVAHSSLSQPGGIGLGLSIVKHLVTLQHGTLFLESKPGKGSDFYFELSFAKQKRAHHDIISSGPQKIRVLLVEDNLINQKLAVKVLNRKGFETFVAENGKEALARYEEDDFDIILMDLQMPEMNGYEATQKIRALSNYKKDIPIIGLTAHAFTEERQRCLDIGMNDFVPKPFDAAELYDRIYSQL